VLTKCSSSSGSSSSSSSGSSSSSSRRQGVAYFDKRCSFNLPNGVRVLLKACSYTKQ
jgi:hypothetical protein